MSEDKPTPMALSALVIVACALPACWSMIEERHYYQGLQDGRVTNYYRLDVDGYTWFSAARYISGYYDERAVDLFFNELKVTATQDSDRRPLFPDQLKDPGSSEIVKPLSPGDNRGTFVMVLSSNARAVTDAIGQFAENQAAADAITNIVNRSALPGAAVAVEEARAEANAAEVDALLALVPSGDAPGAAETSRAYLRVLDAIARQLGGAGSFADLDAAAAWFRARAAGG